MTSPKVFMVTKEGLKNLQADLEHLQTVRRKEIAGKIREAKEFGDLSENAEYHDAKNEQALVELSKELSFTENHLVLPLLHLYLLKNPYREKIHLL